MARAIHVFRTPDRFVAGTVGQPGNRTFYLQAVHDKRVVSVILEKQQVAVLAERIAALLLEINRRFGTPVPPETGEVDDLSPLITPVDAEFRVGTMGLGWDSEAQTVVVELLAVSETEFDASVVLDDAEDGPDAVRVFLTPESARQFATRSTRVISAGRPPCPLCDEPLDPEGHICVRTNGYLRGAIAGSDDDAERIAVQTPLLKPMRCCGAAKLTVIGRIRSASNATFLCEAHLGERQAHCVYKPIAGEAPLWDFPDGTLAGRELAAYLVSDALGWNIVPYTIIRDGPAGRGMLQLWVDQPGESLTRSATNPQQVRTSSTCCPPGRSRPASCRSCRRTTTPATR